MTVLIIIYILISFIIGVILFAYEYKKYKKEEMNPNVYKFFRKEFTDSSVLLFFYLLLSPIVLVLSIFLALCNCIGSAVLYIVDRIFDNNETEKNN